MVLKPSDSDEAHPCFPGSLTCRWHMMWVLCSCGILIINTITYLHTCYWFIFLENSEVHARLTLLFFGSISPQRYILRNAPNISHTYPFLWEMSVLKAVIQGHLDEFHWAILLESSRENSLKKRIWRKCNINNIWIRCSQFSGHTPLPRCLLVGSVMSLRRENSISIVSWTSKGRKLLDAKCPRNSLGD